MLYKNNFTYTKLLEMKHNMKNTHKPPPMINKTKNNMGLYMDTNKDDRMFYKNIYQFDFQRKKLCGLNWLYC